MEQLVESQKQKQSVWRSPSVWVAILLFISPLFTFFFNAARHSGSDAGWGAFSSVLLVAMFAIPAAIINAAMVLWQPVQWGSKVLKGFVSVVTIALVGFMLYLETK